MESTLVIKVKYGDSLRRFNARVDENNQLDLDMARLRSKILSLFNIPPETNFMLRYVDEDGDLVTLVDDDDLLDVMRQNLKFLKIDLHMSNDNSSKSNSMASGSSTPLRSPRILNPFMGSGSTAVSDDLKSVPESVREILSNLSLNLASKAQSSSPVIGALVDSISKLGLSSDSQPQVAAGLGSKSNSPASGNATHSRSPRILNPWVSRNAAISDDLKSIPEPVGEFLSNLLLNLVSQATASSPVIATLNDTISKLGQTMRNSNSQPQITAGADSKSDASNGSVTPAASCPQPPFVDLTSEVNEQPRENVTRGVGATVPPVDLNVPPSDSNPSQSTNLDAVQVSSAAPEVDSKKGKKDTKDSLKCKGGCPGASTSHAAPGNISTQSRSMGFNPFGECPFSGLRVVDSTASSFENHGGYPFKRSHSHTEAMGGMFHKGVRCDGCGVYPITGPRYKSKVKENYDLCSICFTEFGNGVDYVKMDRPASGRCPGPVKILHEYRHPRAHVLKNNALMKQLMSKTRIDSRFILDVTVIDGTIMAPSTTFTKIWRMRNNGTVPWPKGCQLVWIGGDKFSDFHSVDLEIPVQGIPADKELDIAVDFRAPESPGQYISYWRMAFPTGFKFGQRVWVLIQVDASLKESFYGSSQGLNLNIPLEGSGSKGPENIDINVHPVVGDLALQFGEDPNASTKFGKQQIDAQPRQELGENLFMEETASGVAIILPPPPTSVARPSVPYPIIDLPETAPAPVVTILPPPTISVAPPSVPYPIINLPETAPAPAVTILPPPRTSISPPSVHYPIIDFPETAPAPVVNVLPPPDIGASSSSLGIDGDNSIEETLLKELEEMGFKQVDLNKEILRMNEYNLEQSVDDLCGVSDWDPLLDELQEMGFHDNERNKRLLKKNNGSIKRVVLDLVNGEDV